MGKSVLQRKLQQLVPDFTCGFCQARLGYKIRFADHAETYSDYGDFIGGGGCAVISCANCNRLTILLFDVDVDDFGPSCEDGVSAQLYEAEHPEILHCHWDKDEPFTQITILKCKGQIPTKYQFGRNVPESMSRLINEAANCLAVGSPHAAAVMCRRVLEQLVQHFGIKQVPKSEVLKDLLAAGHIDEVAFKALSQEPTLSQAIEQVKSSGRIDERLFQALSETRRWGNVGAHVDDSIEIERSDVAKLVVLTGEILEYAFAPERLAARTTELSERRSTMKRKTQ